MVRETRRQYTAEFKADAVRLLEEEGYGLSEVSRRLGVDRSCLTRWRREMRGEGQPTVAAASDRDKEAELRRLREEVRKLRMEREILKKAAVSSIDRRNTLCPNAAFWGWSAWREWEDRGCRLSRRPSYGRDGKLGSR